MYGEYISKKRYEEGKQYVQEWLEAVWFAWRNLDQYYMKNIVEIRKRTKLNDSWVKIKWSELFKVQENQQTIDIKRGSTGLLLLYIPAFHL